MDAAGHSADGMSLFGRLNNSQRAFLRIAGERLEGIDWTPISVDAALLETAASTPISQSEAIVAILALSNLAGGLSAGKMLTALDRESAIAQLKKVSYSRRLLIEETAAPADAVLDVLISRASEIKYVAIGAEIETVFLDGPFGAPTAPGTNYVDGIGVANVDIVTRNGRRETIRVELSRFKGIGSTIENEREILRELLEGFVESVRATVPVQLID